VNNSLKNSLRLGCLCVQRERKLRKRDKNHRPIIQRRLAWPTWEVYRRHCDEKIEGGKKKSSCQIGLATRPLMRCLPGCWAGKRRLVASWRPPDDVDDYILPSLSLSLSKRRSKTSTHLFLTWKLARVVRKQTLFGGRPRLIFISPATVDSKIL
jgi:hypothetical protein